MTRLDWDTEVRPVLVARIEPLVRLVLITRMSGAKTSTRSSGDRLTIRGKTLPGKYLQTDGYVDGRRALGNRWNFVTPQERGLIEVAGWPAARRLDYGAQLLDLWVRERIQTADTRQSARVCSG